MNIPQGNKIIGANKYRRNGRLEFHHFAIPNEIMVLG